MSQTDKVRVSRCELPDLGRFCSFAARTLFAILPSTAFINARSWLQDVREHADPHLTCILVGNKVDLCPEADETSDPGHDPTAASVPKDLGPASGASRKQREVPTEEAELWAQEEGLLFVEASAKSGVNVEEAFERATRDILDKIRKGVFDDDRVRAFSC